jgi:hypothetical protein
MERLHKVAEAPVPPVQSFYGPGLFNVFPGILIKPVSFVFVCLAAKRKVLVQEIEIVKINAVLPE